MPRAHIVSILFFLTNRTKIFLDLDGLAIRLKKKVVKKQNDEQKKNVKRIDDFSI